MARIRHAIFICLCKDKNRRLSSRQNADLRDKESRDCLSLSECSSFAHTHTLHKHTFTRACCYSLASHAFLILPHPRYHAGNLSAMQIHRLPLLGTPTSCYGQAKKKEEDFKKNVGNEMWREKSLFFQTGASLGTYLGNIFIKLGPTAGIFPKLIENICKEEALSKKLSRWLDELERLYKSACNLQGISSCQLWGKFIWRSLWNSTPFDTPQWHLPTEKKKKIIASEHNMMVKLDDDTRSGEANLSN